MNKSVDFETMKEMCKHNFKETECTEEDNISCECNPMECPIWNDLNTTEIEL